MDLCYGRTYLYTSVPVPKSWRVPTSFSRRTKGGSKSWAVQKEMDYAFTSPFACWNVDGLGLIFLECWCPFCNNHWHNGVSRCYPDVRSMSIYPCAGFPQTFSRVLDCYSGSTAHQHVTFWIYIKGVDMPLFRPCFVRSMFDFSSTRWPSASLIQVLAFSSRPWHVRRQHLATMPLYTSPSLAFAIKKFSRGLFVVDLVLSTMLNLKHAKPHSCEETKPWPVTSVEIGQCNLFLAFGSLSALRWLTHWCLWDFYGYKVTELFPSPLSLPGFPFFCHWSICCFTWCLFAWFLGVRRQSTCRFLLSMIHRLPARKKLRHVWGFQANWLDRPPAVNLNFPEGASLKAIGGPKTCPLGTLWKPLSSDSWQSLCSVSMRETCKKVYGPLPQSAQWPDSFRFVDCFLKMKMCLSGMTHDEDSRYLWLAKT